MLRLGGQRSLAVSAAATCKNAPVGYPFSSIPQLRARLLVQGPLPNSSHIDGLSIYTSYRSYSSLPPPTATKLQGNKIEPVFPSPGLSRKPKLDLKPAPRTANHVSPGSEAPHAPASAAPTPQPSPVTQSPASQPNPSAPNTNQATDKPPSKVRIAIADVVKAAEQGALAPPPADAGKVGKIWHQVKELFKFYVRGLKQLLVHRQIVKDIKARVREERAQGLDPKMSWEEVHFIKTYKEDLVKLIPFLLILLIVEEALPLVVLYAPFLLPSTCILPNQRARIMWKRDDAQYNARLEARRILSEVGSLQTSVADMPGELVTSLAKVFGLSTRGPVALHRRRLEKHLNYLVNDDRLLVDETMGSHLDRRNLKTAMSERGFLASTDESYLRTTLDKRLHTLGEDAAGWKHTSLEFLFKDLLESSKDVRPTPVD